jgi:hypothetical protein
MNRVPVQCGEESLIQHGTLAYYTYKLSELEFSTSLINLLLFSLTENLVSIEGEFFTPREIAAGVPQGSVFAPGLYSLYVNDAPAPSGTHLALFADHTLVYATEKQERRVLCKLQRGLTAVKSWCKRWNIKISEEATQAVYFSRRRGVPEDILLVQLTGRDISFVNNIKYHDDIFDGRMIWRLHMERTATKVLGTYIRTYSLFRSERLSTNVKLILYKALIRSVVYARPTWEYVADAHLLKLHRMQNRVLRAVDIDRAHRSASCT